jgi:rhodanese-related sulfurtransferase
MREVDQDTFAVAHGGGALVIDVREPHEYVAGHVPGAQLVPMRELLFRLAELPQNAPVYVICASGNRSLKAADDLARNGIDAWSVAGGTKAWIRAGKAVIGGARASAV